MNNKIIKLFIIIDILALIFASLNHTKTMVDTFEHLRMSFLVSEGYVPYRDFFEHHHPLLWYVLAPFMMLLPHNTVIAYYFSIAFSVSISLLTIYIICRIIKRFLGGGQKDIIYYITVLLMFWPIWICLSVLKPDIMTRLFYFGGIYMFFSYAEKRQTRDLVYCALSFMLSFMFLQNIVFSIMPMVIPFYWLLKEEPEKTGKDLLISCIAPLSILGSIVAILYANDMWTTYFELNWLFNAELFDIMHFTDPSIIWYCYPVIFLSLFCWGWLVKTKRSNFYYNTFGVLLLCEAFQRTYFKAVFAQYVILLSMLCAIFIAAVIPYIKKKIAIGAAVVAVIFAFQVNSFVSFYKDEMVMTRYKEVGIKSEDTFFNNVADFMTVYQPHLHYYELFNALTVIDNFLFDRDPSYDVNKFIEDNKVDYLNYIIDPLTPIISDNPVQLERFMISKETLENYQPISSCRGLWKRKPDRY